MKLVYLCLWYSPLYQQLLSLKDSLNLHVHAHNACMIIMSNFNKTAFFVYLHWIENLHHCLHRWYLNLYWCLSDMNEHMKRPNKLLPATLALPSDSESSLSCSGARLVNSRVNVSAPIVDDLQLMPSTAPAEAALVESWVDVPASAVDALLTAVSTCPVASSVEAALAVAWPWVPAACVDFL